MNIKKYDYFLQQLIVMDSGLLGYYKLVQKNAPTLLNTIFTEAKNETNKKIVNKKSKETEPGVFLHYKYIYYMIVS
jgi:hypothetical protein